MVCNLVWMMTALTAPAQQGSGLDLRVAVVNVPVVSERYIKTSDLEKQFELTRVDFTKKRDALKEKIERAGRSLQEELKPGTPEFAVRRKDLAMMEAELQWMVESGGQEIEAQLARSLHSIYGDIRAAVRDVAEERGIVVVMAADQLPPESPRTTNQVRQQIMLQKVLYWHPRVDITEEVVTRVNATYQATKLRGGSPGGGTAPKNDSN